MFYGANTTELAAFARSCGSGAQALGDLLQSLDTIVLSAHWQGPDADSLRDTWASHAAPALGRATATLKGYSAEVTTHAEEQDAASAGEGLGAAGGGGGGGESAVDPAPAGWRDLSGPDPLSAFQIFGGLSGRPAPSGFFAGDGIGFEGMGLSQEIAGIAPGEPDMGGDFWDWVLGKRDSPLPDLPGDSDKESPQTGDPGDIDLGDLGHGDEPKTPPTEPTKPANWPADMPWPPTNQAPVDDDGQYVYGDEGYGSTGDATNDDRPVGTRTDEGGEVAVGTGGGYVKGKWGFSEGINVTEDEHGNVTVTVGSRGGAEVEAGGGSDDGTGVTATGTAEGYAEGGLTVGPDGYGIGWRAGGEVTGRGSYAETNEDGSSSIYTVEATAEAGAHASHYGHRVRNSDGEVTGWASGFDVGGGASAGYSYTEEHISPNGWFQHSTTQSESAGKSVGLSGHAVVSTDEISISVGGGIPGVDTGPFSGASFGINPNRIVEDISGGAFDADDVVERFNEFSPYENPMMPAWA